MSLSIPRVLRLTTLFTSIRNKTLNRCARLVSRQTISVDWRDLKVLHPEGMQIGNHFSAGRGLWLESVGGAGRLMIGDQVNLSDYVHIGCANAVTIGNGVLVGSKVLITDHAHGKIDKFGPHGAEMPPNERPIHSKGPVVIGDNVWLGDGVCVLPGVTIGAGAIIGANSVILRDIPAGSIWAGVPARQIWPHPDKD